MPSSVRKVTNVPVLGGRPITDLKLGESFEVDSPLPGFPGKARATLIEVEPNKYWEFTLTFLGVPFALAYVEFSKGQYEMEVLE